ncbi:hypothetical protein MTO96_013300 [Rhipicephalus appendiculatus]
MVRHKVDCSMVRRKAKEHYDSAGRQLLQLNQVVNMLWSSQGNAVLSSTSPIKTYKVHERQNCTTDTFCPLLLLLVEEPLRCGSHSQETAAEEIRRGLFGRIVASQAVSTSFKRPCKRTTQRRIPLMKQHFAAPVLRHEPQPIMTRREAKELCDSTGRQRQFDQVAARLWSTQSNTELCDVWHVNVDVLREWSDCTTDIFPFPLLLLLLEQPIRCGCLSQETAAKEVATPLLDIQAKNKPGGTSHVSVEGAHKCQLCTAVIFLFPPLLLLLLREPMRRGCLSQETTAEKV